MDTRSTGLILRTRRLTESSLIVHWLTPDLGRLATVAKGALRPKSSFRGKLDLFFRAEFSFARSRRSELHTLREISLQDTHPALRQDLGWLQQASYAAALVEQTTEPEAPIPVIFEMMDRILNCLTTQATVPLTIFTFEMKLLAELGLSPDLADTALSPGAREILKRLPGLDWSDLSPLKLSTVQSAEISRFLQGFLIYHLGRIPAGRNAALGSSPQ